MNHKYPYQCCENFRKVAGAYVDEVAPLDRRLNMIADLLSTLNQIEELETNAIREVGELIRDTMARRSAIKRYFFNPALIDREDPDEVSRLQRHFLAPHAKIRSLIVPKKEEDPKKAEVIQIGNSPPLSEAAKRKRKSWAELLSRVFGIDVKTCHECGGETSRAGAREAVSPVDCPGAGGVGKKSSPTFWKRPSLRRS